ncbi:MAG: hypothetical protein A2Z25_12805 [Planctomycetes bacterium RBG_16_55_9]|nr:MAG: hypothetical protein A2Z25_12805 [Planctomycetes bacterium RBG_16_55_9]
MPGQSKCFQCGSVLDPSAAVVDVHPPRMALWKKPFRGIARTARRWRILPSSFRDSSLVTRDSLGSSNEQGLSRAQSRGATGDACLRGLFLSIIPGFAHLIHRRFREIRWYFVGWLLTLGIGLFLYGTEIGLLFIGLAVGLHAWMALQHDLMRQLKGLGERLGAVLVALIILALVYWAAPRVILTDLTGGYTSLTIPFHNLQRGDYLLAWRDEAGDHPLSRGSLVLVRLDSVMVGRRTGRLRRGGQMVVQIVGLPGETIQISKDIYILDGQPLDSEKYPVPQWLHERKFSTTIPPDSYFVSAEYNVPARGRGGIGEAQIRTVCIVGFEAVRARAFMRWLPLSRRGFIEETE